MDKLSSWFKKNILLVLVSGILFFVPLYPKFPFYFVSEANVAVRVEDFLVAFVVAFWGYITYKKGKVLDLLSKLTTQLFLLYFFIGFLSFLSSILITKNVVAYVAFLHFLRRIEYLMLFFVAYDSLTQVKEVGIYAATLAVSTLGVLIYAVGQKFFSWPVVSTMNREFAKGSFLRLSVWARVNSTFAGHYDLAAFLAIILVLAVAGILIVKKRLVKLLIFVFWLFCLYVLILTASRISFPAYLVALVFLLVLLKRYLLIPFFVLISLLGMTLSSEFSQRYLSTFKISPEYLSYFSGLVKVKPERVVAPTLVPSPTELPQLTVFVTVGPPAAVPPTATPTPTSTPTPTPIPIAEEPVEPTELAVSRSTDIRLKVEWPRAIRAFAKNPILGTGYSSITLATDNDYLRLLGETGVLGALAFTLILVEIFGKALRFVKRQKAGTERSLVIAIMCCSFAYFLNASFIDVFEASKLAFIFWIMMGVLVKIIDLESSKCKRKLSCF